MLGVIDACNPAQLDAALRQLAGGLFGPISGLRDRLLDALAHLEAGLDFVEEPDVVEVGRAELAAILVQGSTEIAALAKRLQARDRPEGHPVVVLVGPPNVGKSRRAQCTARRRAHLVSPQPGTTRDYLEALCDCDGLTVVLVDTAGNEVQHATRIEARAGVSRRAGCPGRSGPYLRGGNRRGSFALRGREPQTPVSSCGPRLTSLRALSNRPAC